MGMPWFPKVQMSGTGLTLASTLAPTLGIHLPLGLRWTLFAVGVVMIAWPFLEVGYVHAMEGRVVATARPIYAIVLFGLLAVSLSIKMVYDNKPTTIHHPIVTYLPENDLLSPTPRMTVAPALMPRRPQLVSTAFHEVYKCEYRLPVAPTRKERAEMAVKLKEAIKTIESAFGVSVRVITTDASYAIEFTPVGPSRLRVFGGGIFKKVTQEVRWLNDDYVIVTISYDGDGPLWQLLGLMPPPDNQEYRDQQRKLAASMLPGISDDKCELL